MFFLDQPFTLLLAASIVIPAVLAIAILKQPPNLGTRSFAALMAGVSLWAFAALFEVSSQDPQTKIFSFCIKFIFIVSVPLSWFTFSLYYANRMRTLRLSTLVVLALPQVITIGMVATNHLHHLMFTSFEMVAVGKHHLLYPHFGKWFWVHATYCYLILSAGFILLAKHLMSSQPHYRRPVFSLMIGGSAPWISNIIFTLKIGPLTYFDLTPIAFIVSGIAFMWGILRYRLLDIVPIARDIVLQNMNDGVVVVDSHEHILDMNPRAAHLIGMASRKLIGTKASQSIPWWPKLKAEAGQPKDSELPAIEVLVDERPRLLRPLQTTLYNKERLLGYLITFRDVSRERRLQDQLFQSQKMEAVGTLAGGVAHDFNNLLMGMQANISLMRLEAEPKSTVAEKLGRIEDQIHSGATLTRQLLGYARKGKYRVAAIDINPLIEDALHVVQRANKNIVVQCHTCPDYAYIKADKGQIELVLLNLCLNAVDAMPQGGTLRVSTHLVSGDTLTHRWAKATKGSYLEVKVSDTGIGMDAATRDRIFEPFFTTKERGRGTGLGLASVYGTVQNHCGHIEVRSQPEKGTTFTLLFPALLQVKAPKCTPTRPMSTAKRDATILLVEDEPLILKYSREMIQSLGYQVHAADSGQSALELFQAQADEIDLVVLDMIMPGMDGLQLYDKLKACNPDIKVIVTSGYSDDGRIDEILAQGRNNALKKPYTRDELNEAITKTLHPADENICMTQTRAI